MLITDQATDDALASGRLKKADMLLLDFPSGLYGFWTGIGPLIYQSVTYVGAGRLLKMQIPSGGIGQTSVPMTVQLNSIPDSDLTPDVLATIELEQWHQRPVLASRVYIDPDTLGIFAPIRLYRGYFDTLEHALGENGEAALIATFESKSRDNQRRGWRVRGDSDQRLIDPDDQGLVYAGTAGSQTIEWGKQQVSAAQLGAKDKAIQQ